MQLEEQYVDDQGVEQHRNINDGADEEDVFSCDEQWQAERFMTKARWLADLPMLDPDAELVSPELAVYDFCLLINKIEGQDMALPSAMLGDMAFIRGLVQTALEKWIAFQLSIHHNPPELRRRLRRGFELAGWDTTWVNCDGLLVWVNCDGLLVEEEPPDHDHS
jgi:hypothetical protein